MKKGFTLIELLIALTIIMLMAGGGAISLNNFNARQKVESARQDVATNLKLAKDYATSMQMPSGLQPGHLASVRVTFSGSTMKVEAVRAEDSRVLEYFPAKTVVPNTVTLTSTPSTFEFMPYKGSVNGSSGVNISLSSTEVTYIVNMSVTNSGLINEK